MNLKIVPMTEEAVQIRIDGADYSLADIVHSELLAVKRVKFAGVVPPHPLIKTMTIQIHSDGLAPDKALSEAVAMSQEKARQLLSAVRSTFPDVRRATAAAESRAPTVEPTPPTSATEQPDAEIHPESGTTAEQTV